MSNAPSKLELDEFRPALINTRMNIWEASIVIPVVGKITSEGDGWEQAKLRLWLVCEAVALLASKECKDPKNWSHEEWRSTLQTMKKLTQENPASLESLD